MSVSASYSLLIIVLASDQSINDCQNLEEHAFVSLRNCSSQLVALVSCYKKDISLELWLFALPQLHFRIDNLLLVSPAHFNLFSNDVPYESFFTLWLLNLVINWCVLCNWKCIWLC